MRTLAVIIALILPAAPISEAVAGVDGLQRAIAHQKMLVRQKQEREFWTKFNAEMAKIDRDLPGPTETHGSLGSPAQSGRPSGNVRGSGEN